MHPTPHSDLNLVLQAFVGGLETALADCLVGAYLQGSFALGGFDRHSDVDFAVLLRRAPTAAELERLQNLHGRIFDLPQPWAQHLEGSYFPVAEFRDPHHVGGKLRYLDHGARALTSSSHCNTRVVRWTVREHGVVLHGPAPSTLIDPIPMAALRQEMLDEIVNWGQAILDHPTRFANRWYQGFIVLSYCRMLNDLCRGQPGSKPEGASWAKAHFDPEWSELIDRAWSTRPDPAHQVKLAADPQDFARTLQFVAMAMDEGRRLLEFGQ